MTGDTTRARTEDATIIAGKITTKSTYAHEFFTRYRNKFIAENRTDR